MFGNAFSALMAVVLVPKAVVVSIFSTSTPVALTG